MVKIAEENRTWGYDRISAAGLLTYYVLFFIHLGSRRVHIAGLTEHPDEQWMKQIARNLTMAGLGFLYKYWCLIHDRDKKFCPAFDHMLRLGGLNIIRLPKKSPNLNAFAERWVRSVKEECLSKLVFFGERGLLRALSEYMRHYHEERNHQWKDNVLLFPRVGQVSRSGEGRVECKERIGGLLKFYYQKAA